MTKKYLNIPHFGNLLKQPINIDTCLLTTCLLTLILTEDVSNRIPAAVLRFDRDDNNVVVTCAEYSGHFWVNCLLCLRWPEFWHRKFPIFCLTKNSPLHIANWCSQGDSDGRKWVRNHWMSDFLPRSWWDRLGNNPWPAMWKNWRYYCWWFRNPIPNHRECIKHIKFPAKRGEYLPYQLVSLWGFWSINSSQRWRNFYRATGLILPSSFFRFSDQHILGSGWGRISKKFWPPKKCL